MSSPSVEPPLPPPPPPPIATAFPETWRRVVTDPRGFFAEMSLAGGLGEPLVFVAICAAIAALGVLVLGWSFWGAVSAFVGLVLMALLKGVVLTLVAQHLFDGRAGFEPTFRVVAYAFAPAVFLWLPRLGVVALLWMLFLQVRGVERVHGLDATRAVVAVAVASTATVLIGLGIAGALG